MECKWPWVEIMQYNECFTSHTPLRFKSETNNKQTILNRCKQFKYKKICVAHVSSEIKTIEFELF